MYSLRATSITTRIIKPCRITVISMSICKAFLMVIFSSSSQEKKILPSEDNIQINFLADDLHCIHRLFP